MIWLAFLALFSFAAADNCAIGWDGQPTVAGDNKAGFAEAMTRTDGAKRWTGKDDNRCTAPKKGE